MRTLGRKTLLGLMRDRRLDPIASWTPLVPALAALEAGDLRADAARLLAAPELRPFIVRLLKSGSGPERRLAAEALSHRDEVSAEEMAALVDSLAC